MVSILTCYPTSSLVVVPMARALQFGLALQAFSADAPQGLSSVWTCLAHWKRARRPVWSMAVRISKQGLRTPT